MQRLKSAERLQEEASKFMKESRYELTGANS